MEHTRKILETEDLVYIACKELGLHKKRCLATINSCFLADVG